MVDTQYRRKTLTEIKLPTDVLLFHILPRLPAKSVLRFMSVSKEWHSFLKKPTFSDMHLLNVTNNMDQHHTLLVLSTTTPFRFCTLNCEAPNDGLSASRPFPFKASHNKMSFIASCNGLVCVGMHQKSRSFFYDTDTKYTDLMLWNPLTGEYKTLSKPNPHKYCYTITTRPSVLYYSSPDDDYKLVRAATKGDLYIYSLKNDAWRTVDCWELLLHSFISLATWLNDNIYFLKEIFRNYSSHKYSVIKFDTKTEKFTEIPTPSFGNQTWARFSFTATQSGCLHFCVIRNVTEADQTRWCTELWNMDGDENWTKVLNYSWISCSEINLTRNLILGFEPLHLIKNGSLLMQYSFKDGLYLLNPENRSYNNILAPFFPRRTIYMPHAAKHIETFVSPNQYIK